MSEDKPQIPPALQRAWAAGVFEARMGTIPKSQNVIRFDTNNLPLMDRFREIVGVGQVVLHERTVGEKKVPYDVWMYRTYTLDDTRTLLKFVLPMLSPNKAAAVAPMLARIESNPHWQTSHRKKVAITDPA